MTFDRGTIGSKRSRRRRIGVPLMRSMECSEDGETRTSSETATCGMAKRWSLDDTMSAATMASVSGILMVNVVPRPCSERMSTVPPISSIFVLTTSMPTPRPDTEVTLAAVEKPGWKMNFATWASLIRSTSESVAMPLSAAFLRMAAKFRPLPSSAISMVIEPPS